MSSANMTQRSIDKNPHYRASTMKRRNRIVIALAIAAGGAAAATELPAFWRPELMGTRIVKASELRTVEGQEGAMQLYFQAPTSTLLNLGLRSMTLAAGTNPHPARPYSQPVESVLVVKEGTLDIQLEENNPTFERLEEGSAVFLAPNQWHALRNSGTGPVSFIEMAWTSPGMNGEPAYPESAVNWRRQGPPGRP
jgi:mannose-6-phosphate isomerase-like protein (cupin superfamily)